jgi:hypothetical protein
MRQRRRTVCLFVPFICLASCASATHSASPTNAPASANAAEKGITIEVPRRVAGFDMRSRRDYRDRDAGVVLRYVRPDSMVIDVFVYPGPDLRTRCAGECARKVMDDEIDTFRVGFPEMIRLGYVQTIEIVTDEPVLPPVGAAWQLGRHLHLVVQRDQRLQRSDFYLFYLPGYRVKVRGTFVATEQRLHELEAFAAEIVPALVEHERPHS